MREVMIDTPWVPSDRPRLNRFGRLLVSTTAVAAINAGVTAVFGVEVPRWISPDSKCSASPMPTEEARALGCDESFGTAFENAIETAIEKASKNKLAPYLIAFGAASELVAVYSVLSYRRQELESPPMELQGVEA